MRSVLTASSEEERAELHADFLEQAEVEQPLEKCVEYIRDNPDEFLDEGILAGNANETAAEEGRPLPAAAF